MLYKLNYRITRFYYKTNVSTLSAQLILLCYSFRWRSLDHMSVGL